VSNHPHNRPKAVDDLGVDYHQAVLESQFFAILSAAVEALPEEDRARRQQLITNGEQSPGCTVLEELDQEGRLVVVWAGDVLCRIDPELLKPGAQDPIRAN
jgi:hypothetical protein